MLISKFNTYEIPIKYLITLHKLIRLILLEENYINDCQIDKNKLIKSIHHDINKIDHKIFIRLIKKNRLTSLIYNSNLDIYKFIDFKKILFNHYRKELKSSLLLAKETLKITKLLSLNNIKFLVIKGVALSLQTTNKIHMRGGGDLDIFISEKEIFKILYLLKENGYIIMDKTFNKLNHNDIAGKYFTYIYSQVKLCLQENITFKQTIDLHWRISWSAYNNFNFYKEWSNRENVIINHTNIPTLNLRQSVLHSCIHSSQDELDNLRSLIDIYKLLKKNGDKKVPALFITKLPIIYLQKFIKERDKSLSKDSKNKFFNFLIKRAISLQLSYDFQKKRTITKILVRLLMVQNLDELVRNFLLFLLPNKKIINLLLNLESN